MEQRNCLDYCFFARSLVVGTILTIDELKDAKFDKQYLKGKYGVALYLQRIIDKGERMAKKARTRKWKKKRWQQYLELKSYKSFGDEEATEWGKKYYDDWLPELQNQEYNPVTPAEKFFRWYTQGVDYVFNRILRYSSISEYDFNNSGFSKEMFYGSVAEINKRSLCENIVVYRYVSKNILSSMKKWSNVSFIRKNTILTDKGYFSTTLCLDSVKGRQYATLKQHTLFKIYVPKGTPCVYVDLVADMGENELLFAPNIWLIVIHSFGKYIECIVEI